LPIAARELLVSQVERRLIENPKASPVARLIDLTQVVPAITGKVELVYEGEQEGALTVARHLVGSACSKVFDRHFPDVIREGSEPQLKNDRYKPILDWFAAGHRLDLSDDMDDATYQNALADVPGAAELVDKFLPTKSPMVKVVSIELVLEGLHQHSLLAKEEAATGTSYSDMLGVMMEGLK